MAALRKITSFAALAVLPALFLALGAGTATAQQSDKIPSIDVSRSATTGTSSAMSPLRPRFDYPNEYLNQTLELQYQISLLERMIQRQGNIARMERSYLDMGMHITPPPPPRGICEQLPMNVPCFQGYPDLYPMTQADVYQIPDEEEAAPELASTAAIEPVPESMVQPENEEPPPPPATEFNWAEVSCLGGQCTAVVSKGDRSATRRTVREGDMLEPGVQIESISGFGVTISRNGQKEELAPAPAPSRGGPASPRLASIGTSEPAQDRLPRKGEGLKEFFARDTKEETKAGTKTSEASSSAPATASKAPSSEAAPAVAESEPIEDLGPPLGATGLF